RAEVDLRAERDVHGLQCTAGPLVHGRRDAEAEGRDVVAEQLLDRGIEPGQELLLRSDRRRVLAPPFNPSVAVDDPGQDLGAAEIDADDTFPVQSARLPYSLDGDGREALPRLPGRAREGQGPARAAADASRQEWARAARAESPQATQALELEAPDRSDPARPARAHHRVGN